MNHRKIFYLMSTGVVVLGIALCVPTSILAQETTPPPDSQAPTAESSNPAGHSMKRHRGKSPESQLKRLTKKLNLTPDQQQQMLPILEDQQKKTDAIRSDSSLTPQDRRQQMRSAMMDSNQKLEAIMTDSQKQQYQQEMQKRHQYMDRKGQGGSGGEAAPPPPQ